MTRMAVDWQVEGVNGSKYDVMFVATGELSNYSHISLGGVVRQPAYVSRHMGSMLEAAV